MTTITSIGALPTGPYEGTGLVGIVITSGIPSYFKISGADLHNIVSFSWYPKDPNSVLFETRKLVLVDNTVGTIMIQVRDNYLDASDRKGRLCFYLSDGSTLSFPVVTYGPVSAIPLWRPSQQGLITG